VNVTTLLGAPSQRMPRFVQMLKDLKKYTDKTHPDSALIKRCLIQIHELSAENKIITNFREVVSISKLNTVAKSIDGGDHLLLFNRKFEHEGSLKLANVTKAKAARKKLLLGHKGQYFFLFDDVLVFCSTKKVIGGEGCKSFNHIETSYLTDFKGCVPSEEKDLIITFHNKETWQLVAHSTKDRDHWVNLIQVLIRQKLFNVGRGTILNVTAFVEKTKKAAEERKRQEKELITKPEENISPEKAEKNQSDSPTKD